MFDSLLLLFLHLFIPTKVFLIVFYIQERRQLKLETPRLRGAFISALVAFAVSLLAIEALFMEIVPGLGLLVGFVLLFWFILVAIIPMLLIYSLLFLFSLKENRSTYLENNAFKSNNKLILNVLYVVIALYLIIVVFLVGLLLGLWI